jgi:hypothetical protein
MNTTQDFNGAVLAPSTVRLSVSDVKWEYEDELPEMDDSGYDAIFPASKVVGNEWGGVRMFPYVEDDDGNRIWISRLPNSQDRRPAGSDVSTCSDQLLNNQ